MKRIIFEFIANKDAKSVEKRRVEKNKSVLLFSYIKFRCVFQFEIFKMKMNEALYLPHTKLLNI